MNISVGSLRRPIFFTSIVILMLVTGMLALKRMPVTMMPQIDIPFVVVSVNYPGAGPKDIESVVTLPLEEELISLEGLKKLSSTSQDSISTIVLEFHMGLSVDTIEQKVRDRVALVKTRFPRAILEPVIQKFDMNATSILTMAVQSKSMDRIKLTDWIDRDLKPRLAQVPKIGRLEVIGGLKREIHVEVDPKKLEKYRLSLGVISQQISSSGQNSPGGLIPIGGLEVGVRSMGEYTDTESISQRVVSFKGGEFPIRVSDIANVLEGSERESTRAIYKGGEAITVDVYRQSGANIVEITDQLKLRIAEISEQMKKQGSDITIDIIVDGSKEIRDNVWDVQETIVLGILLTILVVYLFLASARSTLITGLAIPNSLIGAFVLMYLMGFSINIMTLLALSLAVGLLVDDAIVVRENIFKHIEARKSSVRAALDGVNEVALAVIATTIAIISVFGPVAFIPGIMGQFFKEFGLTVSFAMIISLFDALTVAPILSAYWTAKPDKENKHNKLLSILGYPFTRTAQAFGVFQNKLEHWYSRFLERIIRIPKRSATIGIVFSLSLIGIAGTLPMTFMPASEPTGFITSLTLPPGTPLDIGEEFGVKLKEFADSDAGVKDTVLTIGNANLESNVVNLKINLKPAKERSQKGSEINAKFRKHVDEFKKTLPEGSEIYLVKNDGSGGVYFPVSFAVSAAQNDVAVKYASLIMEHMKKSKLFEDVSSTQKPGRDEITVKVDPSKAGRFGVSESLVGDEVRGRIEGILAGRFRDTGREYDIRVKTHDGAMTFMSQIDSILVPNLDQTPIRLKDVAMITQGKSISKLERLNRAASVTVRAGIAPDGGGLGAATAEIQRIIKDEAKLPPEVKIIYEGDAESFAEMGIGFATALGFGIILLYLVLASLYESFLVPILVMSALPLALGGAFVMLGLAGQGIDMYSLIGILLLMGVATKNSILIVDTVTEHLREITNVDAAIYLKVVVESAVRRLRPIIMTSMALIAGMVPIAVGLNEASAQRTSLGTAVIGGIISSTALTLILLPILLILVRKSVVRASSASGKRNKLVDQAIIESAKDVKEKNRLVNNH